MVVFELELLPVANEQNSQNDQAGLLTLDMYGSEATQAKYDSRSMKVSDLGL